MNCPRCKADIGALTNPDGIVTCPGCGARLMTRAAALRSQGAGARPAAPSPAALPPEDTMPPTPAAMLGITRPPELEREQTNPPAAGKKAAAPAATAAAKKAGAGEDTLALVLRELRSLRTLQERILRLLERSSGTEWAPVDGEPSLSPIRASRRKSVVLIDDDQATRDAALAALEAAEIPVRAFPDGSGAVAAIAEEKPDVIVLELALAGEMEGRDVINMIKATMEWVDIPIVLWTREPVQNQKDARQVHGADEIVPKSGGSQALVARVIALFRRLH